MKTTAPWHGADNWNWTSVELCWNRDDICCLWRDIIAAAAAAMAMIFRRMLDGRAADAGRRHLFTGQLVRTSEMMHGWQTAWRPTTMHISHANSALQCTLTRSVVCRLFYTTACLLRMLLVLLLYRISRRLSHDMPPSINCLNLLRMLFISRTCFTQSY